MDHNQYELMKIQQELVQVRIERRNQYELEKEHGNLDDPEWIADPERTDEFFSYESGEQQPEENFQEIGNSLNSQPKDMQAMREENNWLRNLLEQQMKINRDLDEMLKTEKKEKWRQNEALWKLRDELRRLKQSLLDLDSSEYPPDETI